MLYKTGNTLIQYEFLIICNRAAKTIWAGIHGISQLSLTGKLDTVGAKSMKELTDSLIDNYLRGVRE